MPHVRFAQGADLHGILGVYSACCRADSAYLPFLDPQNLTEVEHWFYQKTLAVTLVACADSGEVVGIAGLCDAEPPGVAVDGRWMEACRLAVDPRHRGGEVTRELTATRLGVARQMGVTHLWLRCVKGSPAHALYLALGWSFLAETSFEGPAACQDAVLLQRPT